MIRRALISRIDGIDYLFLDDLNPSAMAERLSTMRTMSDDDSRMTEFDITERDTERAPPPSVDEVPTLVENLKPEAEAGL